MPSGIVSGSVTLPGKEASTTNPHESLATTRVSITNPGSTTEKGDFMNHSKTILRNALSGLLAVGMGVSATAALAQKGGNEKCAGIVKAGKNDCGTSYSSCAGTSKVDNDKEAWVYLPKGTCERISGGRIQTSADAKKGGKG
jgi:uncharacterized membrane protein